MRTLSALWRREKISCLRPGGDRQAVAGARRRVAAWRRDSSGASAVYLALLAPLIVGAGVLAVDVGRLVVLRSQMQNAADATAITAGKQLDGDTGARSRATGVANSALSYQTRLADDDSQISVAAMRFYSQVEPSKVTADEDIEARFVEVELEPRSANTILDGILSYASGSAARAVVSLDARAVATPAHIICRAPPLMICDPTESLGAGASLKSPANVGRQLLVKSGPGGSPFAPGNFGLLCPTVGNCGADNVGDELAAETPASCYTTDVETSPGVQTQKVRNAINARFDTGNVNPKKPAKNIIDYPRDSDMGGNTILGNGDWDPVDYWNEKHLGLLPPDDLENYTRYQIYLYELGETFARNGKQTIYPSPGSPPAGYDEVDPLVAQVPLGGIPLSPASDLIKRRVVQVAVLKCDALDVRGSGTYPTFGNYVEMFITERMATTGSDLYAELIGPITSVNFTSYHANVRLVD